jgi:hypothetical protein
VGDGTQERIGRNEALFREVNEAIARGLWPGEDGPVRFRCECARVDCREHVELGREDYEQLRREARCFVLVEGHELPEPESVVDVRPGYVVVQKHGVAGAVAEATDPRRQSS